MLQPLFGSPKELISALDLHTVPWNQLPRRLKQHLQLPLEDRGIDSLALNLTVAVQAKDYGGAVPLNRCLGGEMVRWWNQNQKL